MISNPNNCVPFLPLGVKEAFLKVAQGVIHLFQQNLLGNYTLEPSYSPMNSYPTNQLQSSTTYNQKPQRNGQHTPAAIVNVDSHKDDERGYYQKCCS